MLNPVDVKKYNHGRHHTVYGYKYYDAKLARVIFTMIDGSELQLYYAYSRIGRTFFKYQPQTSVDYEDINKANGISALKTLLN